MICHAIRITSGNPSLVSRSQLFLVGQLVEPIGKVGIVVDRAELVVQAPQTGQSILRQFVLELSRQAFAVEYAATGRAVHAHRAAVVELVWATTVR